MQAHAEVTERTIEEVASDVIDRLTRFGEGGRVRRRRLEPLRSWCGRATLGSAGCDVRRSLMRTVGSRLRVVLLATLIAIGIAGPAQATTSPIGPNQHYVGFVNGKHVGAVIDVVCPGHGLVRRPRIRP